jgi:hypothetical protein
MKQAKAVRAEKTMKADANKVEKALEWFVLTRALRHYT